MLVIDDTEGDARSSDIQQRLLVLKKDVEILAMDIEKLKRAFLKDDLGTPDTDGHRKAHIALNESAKLVEDYKISITKDILKTIVAAGLGALCVGIISFLRTS